MTSHAGYFILRARQHRRVAELAVRAGQRVRTAHVFLTFSSGQPADFVNVNWIQFRR
jgi:hypothetical protein